MRVDLQWEQCHVMLTISADRLTLFWRKCENFPPILLSWAFVGLFFKVSHKLIFFQWQTSPENDCALFSYCRWFITVLFSCVVTRKYFIYWKFFNMYHALCTPVSPRQNLVVELLFCLKKVLLLTFLSFIINKRSALFCLLTSLPSRLHSNPWSSCFNFFYFSVCWHDNNQFSLTKMMPSGSLKFCWHIPWVNKMFLRKYIVQTEWPPTPNKQFLHLRKVFPFLITQPEERPALQCIH